MSQKIYFLILFLSQINTLCNEGCLKCNKNQQCQICDVSKFMRLRIGKCELVQEEHCTKIQLDGTCLTCKTNYFVDATTKKCTAVDENYKIDNCLSYGEQQECLLCENEYYTLNGKCVKVSIKISNCKIYLNDTTCSQCDVGYLLSLNGKTCNAKPTTSNCQDFSTVECVRCSKNFIINKNIYQKQIFSVNSEFEIDYLLHWKFTEQGLQLQQDNVCQKQVVENCLEVEDFDSCKKCNNGYYLTDSKFCLPYPSSIILNCEIYSAANVCAKCINKYYKKNSNTCLPVTLIDNCLIYGQTENDQGCKECEPNFYLDSNTCKPRENDIKNCSEYELIDRCKSCGPGYILTNDRLKCLPSIIYCDTYESSSKETIQLTCQKCIDGFFLVSNNCQQGSNVNCAKYTESSTFENQICSECVNKFYLSEGNCLEIQTLSNCSKYHKTQDKSCVQCEGLFFNFQLENKCEIFTEIINCIRYDKDGDSITCLECADTYFLDTEKNTCESLSVTHPFCNKVDAGRVSCIECQPFKILINGQCINNMPYNTEFCDKVIDDQDLSDATCEVCKESSYPHRFNNVSVCLTQDELGQTLQVDQTLCQIYNDDGSCKICKNNYVEDEGTCVTACPAGKYLIKYKNDRVNYCQTEDSDYEDGCAIMINYKYSNIDTLECSKCKENYLPYNDNDYNTKLYNGNGSDKNINFMNNIVTKNVAVKCQQLTSSVILNLVPNTNGQPPTPDPNCLLWVRTSTNNFHCQRCIEFYTFQITNGAAGACTQDNQFSLQKIYSTSMYTQRFISGYQCVDRSLSVLVQLTTEAKVVSAKSNLQSKSNQCVSKQQIENEYPGSHVENCAIYVYSGTELVCADCFPGYKKQSSTECVAIEHCEGFLWFSACSKCQSGYAYSQDGNVISYDNCVPLYTAIVNDNCLTTDPGASNGMCKLCKKGYMLNVEETCEKILFPKCDSTEYFNYTDKNYTDLPYEYYLYYGAFNQGCNKCLEGYISVNKNIDSNVCLFSYFLRDFANDPELWKLTQHCKKYKGGLGLDDEIFCQECYKGKLIRHNSSSCLDEVPHCKSLVRSGECYECASNQFANIEGVCKELEIEHCLEYNVFSSSVIQCMTCKDGYFAEGKKCIKTEVLNCKKPSSKTECIQCIENSYLINLSEDRDYCISLSTMNNCKEADVVTDGQYGGKITCTSCTLPNSYIVTQENSPELFSSFTECMRVDTIENCGELNIPQILESNSFVCDQCVGNFYLSDSSLTCLPRTNLSLSCEIFNPNDDKCMSCNNTSYLVDQGVDCQSFPDGLVGCKKYLYRYTCEVCHPGYYLVESDCKQIPEANLIENCEIYKNEKECEKCIEKFFVSENKCVQVKVSNCKILQDENTCQECLPGYGLAVRGTVIDCELISKNRCLIFDQTQPYPCLVCNEGFYPDEAGECTESKPKIDYCIQQESQEVCVKCQKGSVLSKDQSKCHKTLQYTSKIPFDCEQAVEKEPFCTSCQPGYKFNKEGLSCVQCNAVQSNSGCAVCDPYDDNICFMCKSGYKQDQDGTCTVHAVEEPIVEVIEENIKVFSVELLMLVFLILF